MDNATPMNETALNHPPADAPTSKPLGDKPKHCKYCGVEFNTNKPHQVFCTVDHKRAYEKIVSELISELRTPIVDAAAKLANARNNAR